MIRHITLHDRDWVLAGRFDGPITTIEDLHAARPPYAHVHRNGEIRRNGQIIGYVVEITFGPSIDMIDLDTIAGEVPTQPNGQEPLCPLPTCTSECPTTIPPRVL